MRLNCGVIPSAQIVCCLTTPGTYTATRHFLTTTGVQYSLMSAGTGHQSHGIVVQMLVWHRILEWAQGVRVVAAAATPIEVAAEGRRCLARKKKKKMVSSDGRRSAFSLQMNWKRLAPILQPLLLMLMLMLCSFPPVASGARYDYDTSTIVNKYIGARKSQEKEPRHHQQQQQQQQQQRTNDARLMTKDAGGGGGGGGEGGVEKEWGGNCENVMDLQSAVIRILNAHYEYDQAILVMHDSIETIRKDISQLRKKIDSVSHEVSWRSFAGRTSTDDDSSAAVQGSVPDGASYPADSGVGVPLTFALSPPSLTVRLDNLTFIVDRQGHRLVQLDKRLRRMRHGSTAPLSGGHPEGQRPLKQTASGPGLEEKTTELERERERLREREKELERERERQKEREKELENERERQREAELERQRQREADVETERQRQRREELMILRCEREMELTRELTRKQREINANVQRKIQLVEKVMQENMQQQQRIQGDAPHNHLNSPQQLVNGACPNGFMRYLSSCYLFENVTANWVDAEKRCQALNHDAHLVSIDNDDEEEFLIKYRSYNNVRWSSRYLWIGANDMALEGRWSWVANGADIGYSNWRKGEPSNYRGEQHCAYLQTTDGGRAATAQRNSAAGGGGGESGRWDDWHCQSARINFACEIVVR